MEKTKSVGIWIRVSTEDQAQGESPEHHEKRARLYAESKGWDVRTVYHLEAVSGKSVMEHPEAKRMLKEIKNGFITGLIFSKLARLARNTRELLDFADYFIASGADLISLQEAIDTSTPAGRLFYTMIAAMAQWEREEIASRVQASVGIRAKLGKPLGGQAPFGYKWQGNELVIEPKEAPVRKLMYELYLEHKRRKTVSTLLNKKGYRTRNGSLFSDTTVERLLRDPMAKGTRRANYTKSLGDGKQWVTKPSEEWVLTKCPPIVTEELWQACNSILDAQSASRKPRGKISPHLFTGLLLCTCGGKMYIAPRSSKYQCSTCKKTQIPKDDIEEIYFEQLKGYLLTKDDLATFQKRGQGAIESKEAEKNLLATERIKVKADMDKLVELHLQGEIPSGGFKGYYDPLDTRLKQIDLTLAEMTGQMDFLKVQLLNGEYILGNAENLYEKWPTYTRDEKRKVIEDQTESITLGNDEITIKFYNAPDLLQNEQNSQHNLMLALPFRNLPIVNDNPLIKIKLDEVSPIGLHIRKKRLQLQMKQGDVAKVIGVSEDCITFWENGRSKPQIQHMPKIIEFLGYNPTKIETITLSGRIKKYRIEHGLSTSGFGELVGVDGATVGAWEAQTSFPQPRNKEALEKVVGKVQSENLNYRDL